MPHAAQYTRPLDSARRREEAAAAYRRALELVTNPAERDFLQGRLEEL